MIKSLEALIAAILVISFMFLIVEYPHITDYGLKYRVINTDKVRTCHLSSTGYPLKVLVLKFNESFDHACVKVNYPANYTYAVSKKVIPSQGGDKITLEIDKYEGEPIFIYVTNSTSGNNFQCKYPFKDVSYHFVVENSDYKLECETK